jgi:hypothetical protein
VWIKDSEGTLFNIILFKYARRLPNAIELSELQTPIGIFDYSVQIMCKNSTPSGIWSAIKRSSSLWHEHPGGTELENIHSDAERILDPEDIRPIINYKDIGPPTHNKAQLPENHTLFQIPGDSRFGVYIS